MECRLVICIILYNEVVTKIQSLETFRQAMSLFGAKILIMDNSTNEEIRKINSFESEKIKFTYFSNDGNIGLSRAYNNAINYASNFEDYWMMLADDDTYFSMDYLNNVYRTISNDSDIDIFTGIVKVSGNVFSPKNKLSFSGTAQLFIEKPGVYSNIFPVNTGLVIHKCVFDKIGKYDENLFLDMIDFNFANQLTSEGINLIKVIEGEISQSFSGYERGNYKGQMVRYSIFKKDFSYFCKRNNISVVKKRMVLARRYINIIKRSLIG